MEWKDVSKALGSVAPVLGTLVGGPAGAAIGAVVAQALGVGATPGEVSQALTIDPEAAVKLKQIEATRQTELQGLVVAAEQNRLAADTAAIQAVNATMQVEAKADHWPTYFWRPFCGMVFGTMFFGTYFILPLLKMPVPVVPLDMSFLRW